MKKKSLAMGSLQHLSVLGWRDFAERRSGSRQVLRTQSGARMSCSKGASKHPHKCPCMQIDQLGQYAQHPQKLVVPWIHHLHVRSINLELLAFQLVVGAVWRWCLMRVRLADAG